MDDLIMKSLADVTILSLPDDRNVLQCVQEAGRVHNCAAVGIVRSQDAVVDLNY